MFPKSTTGQIGLWTVRIWQNSQTPYSVKKSTIINWLVFFRCFFIHFIIPFGKIGPPYLGTATAAARAALPRSTSACWVFSYPSNSDMDYGIFNVRTWSFLCVRICTGVGHTHRPRVSTTLFTRKNSHKVFLCSWRGSNLGSLDLESDALTIEPPLHPIPPRWPCG